MGIKRTSFLVSCENGATREENYVGKTMYEPLVLSCHSQEAPTSVAVVGHSDLETADTLSRSPAILAAHYMSKEHYLS